MNLNKTDKFHIEMMLREWRAALTEGSWVSDIELSVLKERFIRFVEHHSCEGIAEVMDTNDSLGG